MTELSIMHKNSLKRKYKDTDGLQDTVWRCFATFDGKFVQVLHVNNNHWICVARNKNNEVSVYDSMSGNLSKDTVYVIARMVKCEDEELMVKLMPVQHQTNSNNCGLFALAFATDICHWKYWSLRTVLWRKSLKKPSTAMFEKQWN